MSSSTSTASSLQNCNSLDGLKLKNRKYMKCEKRVAIRILKTKASKNKPFYRCDDMSCDNTFIDCCCRTYAASQ